MITNTGTAGADNPFGTDAADTLKGLGGDDQLTGGKGAGTFVFARDDGSGPGSGSTAMAQPARTAPWKGEPVMKSNLLRYGTAVLLGAGMLASLGAARTADAAAIAVSTCQSITKPGSYKVTNNLKASNFGCIVISADDVTLDLDQHEIRNNGGPLGSGVSVSSPGNPPRTGITLRNGTIGVFDVGVNAPDTVGMRIENIASNVNGGNGITVGPGAFIRNVQVRSNGRNGITAGAGSFITNVLADGNRFDGISAGPGSVILNSSATFGTTGIVMLNDGGGRVAGNVAEGNTGAGILVDCPVRVENNKPPQSFPNGGRNFLLREWDILKPGPTFQPFECFGTQTGAVVTATRTDGFPSK